MNRVSRAIQIMIASFAAVAGANAQYSNPVLTTPSDVRVSALGEVALMSQTMPLYGVASNVFSASDRPLSLGYSLGLTPQKSGSGRQYFHALAGGYKFSSKHALMLGARCWGGLEVEYYNTTASRVGLVHPRDWTVDAGYAFAPTSRWQIYTGVSYLNTYSSQSSYSLMAHLGVTYRSELNSLRDGRYALDLSVHNLGTRMYFRNDRNSSSDLPTYVQASGMMAFEPVQSHTLSLAASASYYTYDALESDQALSCRLGVEYDMSNILAVRLGGVYTKNNSFLTMGLGRDFGRVSLNLAYTLGSYSQFNHLSFGVGLSL